MRSAHAMILLALLLAGAVAHAGEPVMRTLENGLTVIVSENHSAPIVALRVYVKTGSVYEGRWLGSGLSHYLEHLLNDGTTTRTKDEINRIVEEIGNASNAYTSDDTTAYFITTASAYFDTALDVLADCVQNATFPAEEVETQRGVILREIAMCDDDPDRALYDLFMRTLFEVHPARHRIIGYTELFSKLTREDILQYYRERYVPENTVVVVVGDLDAEEMIEKVSRAFAMWPRTPLPGIYLEPEPKQMARREAVRVMPTLSSARVMIGYHTVSIRHPDLYPLDLLSYILTNGRTSRLHRLLVEEMGIAERVGSWSVTPPYDAGYFAVNLTLDPRRVRRAERVVLAELERLKTEPVTDDELERAKAQKEAELVFARQTAEDQASVLGSDWISTGDLHFSEHYVERLKRVTADDIMRVARAYFTETNQTLAVLTPKPLPSRGGGRAAAIEVGPITKQALPNGITLLLQENHELPIVSVLAAFEGGVRYETEQTNGICRLMTNLLVRGTRTRTRDEIARTMEDVGGTLSPFSGKNSFGVQASARSVDFERTLDLVADVLINPTFPDSELAREKELTLAAIDRIQDDPFSAASELFRQTMWLRHPYRLNELGTRESVERLTAEDLRAFHRDYCAANRMVLAIFGDIDLQQAREKAQTAFADMPRSDAPAPAVPQEEPLTAGRQQTREREGEQAILFIGTPGQRVTDEDRYKLAVLDAVFSGIYYPGGRLHETLRSKQLVYLVHAFGQAGIDPGAFIIQAACAPDKLQTVQAEIDRLIRELQQTPISAEELERGKRICISMNLQDLDTNGERAWTAALDELYGLGYDNYTHYAERINAVTADDVQAMAREYLSTDTRVVAVIMPREDGGR
jgi:zinc protease